MIPEGEVFDVARCVQKRVSDYYNLYPEDKTPQIHITLDKIKEDNLLTGKKIIKNSVYEINELPEIYIDKIKCLRSSENKFLVMDVVHTESLLNLAENIHKNFAEKGISIIDNYSEWSYHITIISNIFAQNPIPKDQLEKLCYHLEGFDVPLKGKAHKIEIWRPTLDTNKKCLSSFNLQEG